MTWAQPASIAVYVHWPFCAKKCPYCDFAVTVRREIDEAATIKALKRDLDRQAKLYPRPPGVHSIYFGGGTPSLMQPASVAALIDHIDRLFGCLTGCEITLEANPTDTETNKLKAFRSTGVNRLSLGIQSLDDTELLVLGRNHNAQQARDALDSAAMHFDNFSMDLMYALPRQKTHKWTERVHSMLAWHPTHVSLYQLTIEPGTVFDKALQRGVLTSFDNDKAADLYEQTASTLEELGYPAYEVSNHARVGFESRHNLSYWRYEDYVGVGPGAHGRLTIDGRKHATENPRLLSDWEQHERVVAKPLTAKDADEEAFLMSMRTREGAIVGGHLVLNQDRLAFLKKQKMLEPIANSFRPTREGWLRLDTITGMLLT